MSNKDLCQIKTFSFRESSRLDSTSKKDCNQNKSTHCIDRLLNYFMFTQEEFIVKVLYRRKWFFDGFTGYI